MTEKTSFGGSINVPILFEDTMRELHEQMKTFFHYKFTDGTCPSDIAMSVEDKQALAQIKTSVVKSSDIYQVVLSWRQKTVALPNNII